MINFPNFNKRKQLNVCSRLYLPSDFLSFLLFVFSALCSHQAELTVLIFLMFSSIDAAGVLLRQDYAHTHTNAPKKINILILALQKPIILPSSVFSLSLLLLSFTTFHDDETSAFLIYSIVTL